MADKQYSRKLADEDHGFEEERDPLAELARVVGYGDYAHPYKTSDDDPDTGAELEDELLRALGSRDDAQAGSGLAGNRPHRDDDASMPESHAVDEADAMTLSLEEDLLRELEGGGEPPKSPNDTTAEPAFTELEEAVASPAQGGVGSKVSSGDAAEFELTDTEVPAADVAAEDGDSEGFVFPSADELEVDADFAGQSWKPSGFGESGSPSAYRDVPQIDASYADAGCAVDSETAPSATDRSTDDIPDNREDTADDEVAVAANSFGTTCAPAPAETMEADARVLDPETEAGMIFDSPPGDEEITDHPETTGPRDADDASSASAVSQTVGPLSLEPTVAPDELSNEAVLAIEADAARSVVSNLRQAEISPRQEGEPQAVADEGATEDGRLQQSAPAAEAAAATVDYAAEEPALRATDDDAVEVSGEAADVNGIDEAAAARISKEGNIASARDAGDAPMESENAAPEVEVAAFAADTQSDADDPIPDLDDVLREITAECGPNVAEQGGFDLGDAVTPEHVDPHRIDESIDRPEVEPVGFAVEGEPRPEPVEAVDEAAVADDFDGIERELPVGSLAAVAAAVAVAGDTAEGVFDPATITAHDEIVDPVADLDVPALPDDDPAPAVLSQDDAALDYDVDAALARLVHGSDSAAQPAADQPADETGYTAAAAITGGAAAAAASTASAHGAEAEHPAFADHFDPDELERALDAHLNELEEQGPIGDAGSAAVGGAAAAPAQPPWQNWKVLVTGVAVITVIAGAVITFGFDSSSTPDTGAPRIIAADAGPVKQKPKNPGGKVVPNQNKIVYNQVDGTTIDAPTQKTLISSDESPIDVVQRTLRPDLPRDASMASGEPDGIAPAEATDAGAASATEMNGDTVEAPAKSQERLAPGDGQPAPTRALPNGVMPHYVKTMTVNANGKLVVADPQPASNAAQTEMQSASATASPASSGQAEQSASPNASSQVETTKQTPLNGPAPLPVARPVVTAPQTASTEPAATQSASTPAPAQPKSAAATPQPTATATANNSQTAVSTDTAPSYFVQISSQPTEAGAKASYSTLNRRYASLLDGRGVDIQRANIEGKGTYYRVRIPANSRDDAVSLCQSYKAAGGSCFVAR